MSVRFGSQYSIKHCVKRPAFNINLQFEKRVFFYQRIDVGDSVSKSKTSKKA